MEEIKTIFEKIKECNNWGIDVIRINETKKEGKKYIKAQIENIKRSGITSLVEDISNNHLENIIDKYDSIQEYTDIIEENVIYKLDKNSILVKEEYEKIIECILSTDVERNPLELKSDCYLLKGKIKIHNEYKNVILISMSNPVKTIRNCFVKNNTEFEDISGKVLVLKENIDVIFYDNNIYFFNTKGEKLFNIEKTKKVLCKNKLAYIENADIVDNFEEFEKVAMKGQNPSKFLCFNNSRLELLKENSNKEKYATLFGLEINDNKFTSSSEENCVKLIKVLCGKGNLDPFENKPIENSGVKGWYK